MQAVCEVQEAGNDCPCAVDSMSIESQHDVGPVSFGLLLHQQMVVSFDVPNKKSHSKSIGRGNTEKNVGCNDEQLTVPGKDPSVVENHVDAVNDAVGWAGNDRVQIPVTVSWFSFS